MRFHLLVSLLLLGGGLAMPSRAEYKLYPGAKQDLDVQKASEIIMAEHVSLGATTTAMTSPDPFEKVLAFYQKLGKEVRPPAIPGLALNGYERELPTEVKLGPRGLEGTPSGVKVKSVYFILDGAAEYEASKDTLMIASPMVLGINEDPNGRMHYSNIKPGTSIIRVQIK